MTNEQITRHLNSGIEDYCLVDIDFRRTNRAYSIPDWAYDMQFPTILPITATWPSDHTARIACNNQNENSPNSFIPLSREIKAMYSKDYIQEHHPELLL